MQDQFATIEVEPPLLHGARHRREEAHLKRVQDGVPAHLPPSGVGEIVANARACSASGAANGTGLITGRSVPAICAAIQPSGR